jgi:hypothetical protein
MNIFRLAEIELHRENREAKIAAIIDRAKIIRDFIVKNRGKIERIAAGVPYMRDKRGIIRISV